MKAFVVLALVAAASASPQLLLNNHLGLIPGAVTYSAAPLVSQAIVTPAVTKTQYHAQDELGQASYGYAHPGQAHAAVRDAAGNVRGSYAYVNPEGKEVRVEYVADGAGFRVASNALPVGPAGNPVVANLVAPAPVQDTPEVVAARAAHLAAHSEALARSGRKKRALLTSAVIPTTHALGYSSLISHPVNTLALGNTVLTSSHIASPLVASPALTYSSVASPALTYSAIAAPSVAVRDATLTTVQNNPGHAVSYRVD